MSPLLAQLKKRRIALGYKQNDMLLRAGISRQQYQRLESQGNPRLNTLELVARGLKSELMLIPKEKLHLVKALLEEDIALSNPRIQESDQADEGNALAHNPWQGILRDTE